MRAGLLAALALGGLRAEAADPYVVVLGVAQDAGHPQIACARDCCRAAWADPAARHTPASLAIVDPDTGQRWLIDATPALPEQLHALEVAAPRGEGPVFDGVLLTHAHIGHYTGLMHLGREALGADGVPVWAMPRMRRFLKRDGPWSQLVALGQIDLRRLAADRPVALGDRITVTPFRVPHRDELSETVGFRIEGPSRAALYVPDTDRWETWAVPLEEHLAGVDRAWLDATFFDGAELPGRDLSTIPHPPVVATLARLADVPEATRAKVHLIHLNHTNPLLQDGGPAHERVEAAGLRVASEGDRFPL